MELTLVSYNVHSGIGTDGRFDLRRVGEVLQEIGPDIAALQEVGDYLGKTPDGAQPELLAEMLGLQLAYGPNVVRDGRQGHDQDHRNCRTHRHPRSVATPRRSPTARRS